MQEQIYFVSDIHLGVPDRHNSLEREKKLIRWLTTVANDATEIIILGDLFDFWFEYQTVAPKGYVRLLGKLAELSDRGIKIHLFKGNHDMWMFGYLEEEIGLSMHSDEWVKHWGGKTFYMHHGDGLGPGDHSYKRLRKLFRNPVAQKMFGVIHPDIGMRIAQYFSKRSRLANNEQKEAFDEENEWLLQFCKEQQRVSPADFYIFGHRHLSLDIHLEDGSRYINLGEWVTDSCYGHWDGKEMHLKRFEDK